VELHTSPDLESASYAGTATGYAAELSNIATYHGQDADDADRNYRDGNRRMVVLGHSVNLTANTAYYYRLHCGGDMEVGYFKTLPTLTSTATQTIARTAASTGVTDMIVEYGTAYSRATDTISGGGTSTPAACTKGNRCVATFSATKGTVLYYRWKERDRLGSVLVAGKVEALPGL
jgi:hypothetical protein